MSDNLKNYPNEEIKELQVILDSIVDSISL